MKIIHKNPGLSNKTANTKNHTDRKGSMEVNNKINPEGSIKDNKEDNRRILIGTDNKTTDNQTEEILLNRELDRTGDNRVRKADIKAEINIEINIGINIGIDMIKKDKEAKIITTKKNLTKGINSRKTILKSEDYQKKGQANKTIKDTDP